MLDLTDQVSIRLQPRIARKDDVNRTSITLASKMSRSLRSAANGNGTLSSTSGLSVLLVMWNSQIRGYAEATVKFKRRAASG
jgi:hypothetical protein